VVGGFVVAGSVVGGRVMGGSVVGGFVVGGSLVGGFVVGCSVTGGSVVGGSVVGGRVVTGGSVVGVRVVGWSVTGGFVVTGGGDVVTPPDGLRVRVWPPPSLPGPSLSLPAIARPAFKIIPIPIGTEMISAALLAFPDRIPFGANMRYPPPAMRDNSFYHVRPKLSQGLSGVFPRKWLWSDLEKWPDVGEADAGRA